MCSNGEVGLHRLTEALDLEVYALAALSILGPAFVRLLPERAARFARVEKPAAVEAQPLTALSRGRYGGRCFA